MNRKFNPKIDTIRASFFPKSSPFSIFEKKQVKPPPSPVVARLLVWLNMHQYPWKCMNKLFWLCQGSEHAQWSYMFHMLLKMHRVLNVREFWIWHGCICKCYTEFWRLLNMAQYASICLNVSQCSWKWWNITGWPRVCLKVPEYVLNMPHHLIRYLTRFWRCFRHLPLYSYNTIIFVTNAIIWEFLSAWFVHLGAPQLTIFSFLNTS